MQITTIGLDIAKNVFRRDRKGRRPKMGRGAGLHADQARR
jgi:hypothetical protein